MTFQTDVDDLFAVAEATDAHTGHLVGGSFGAIVALHAAVDPRAAWRSVTVFEPPLFAAGPDLAPVLARYRTLVAAGRLTAAARVFAAEVARLPPDLLGPDADTGDSDPTSEAAASAIATALGCAADLEAMLAASTDLHRRRHIAAHVLLLQGELTWPPMPATMTQLRRALPPSTENVVLRGQSHFAPHTAPQQFAAALLAFLDRHPGAA